MAVNYTILRDGRVFWARPDNGEKFFIAYATGYTDRSTREEFRGLFNIPSRQLAPIFFEAAAFRDAFGVWADFVAPTAACEGGNFLTLNTYDRARFTWGFGQFGAHVPEGDFVLFLRDLLGRPEAGDFFPDLVLRDGRITCLSSQGEVLLETKDSTQALMDYLNPTSRSVEDAEVLAAARLIDWTMRFPAAQHLQVHHMVGAFRNLMTKADQRLSLHGRSAAECCIVCDILHQGRARFSDMQQALASGSPVPALLKLGSIAYPERVKTLRAALSDAAKILGPLRWDRARQDFT